MELTSPKFACKMSKLQYPSDFSFEEDNRSLLCHFLIMQTRRPNAVNKVGPGAWFRGALFPYDQSGAGSGANIAWDCQAIQNPTAAANLPSRVCKPTDLSCRGSKGGGSSSIQKQ